MKNSISQGLRLDQKVSKGLRATYETVTGRLRDDKPRNISGARVAQEWLKYAAMFVMLLTLGVGNAWGVEATFNLWQTAPGSPTTNNNVSFAYSGCVFEAYNANAGFTVNGQVVATMPTGATVSKIVVHKTSNSWAKKANLKVYCGNTLKQTITQPSGDVTINLSGSEQTAGTYKFKNEGSNSKVAFVKSIVITYTVSECSNPEIGTQPASATYTVGDSQTALSVTASGTSLTYQWYSNTTATNTGGTIIIGQTSSTYTPSTASNGTFYYYCVVSSGSCSTNSNVATITVNKTSATIKLSEAGAESTVSGTHYSGDSYTLPSSTEATCGTKVLVGWSTVTVAETDTKPTSNFYEKGASVTLSAGENKFYAVFATESGGDPVSISGGDMASSLPSGWSSIGTDGFYSNNGVKFNSTGDYILSGDISSHGLTSVTVKFKAGYNGYVGSVLRIEAIDEEGHEIGGVNFTPTEAYNAQSTINSVVVSASGTIYYIAVEMTEKTSNVGVKYCEVFKGGTTYSAYSTTCCNQLAAPANPGETPNSTGAVLTWDAVTGATGYEVKIDGGAWTSTGNGTTTGYTITGKACGGTNVSWQVRATGDGSINCAAGAATSVRNFNTTACACTSQYTYFWGTSITNDNPAASAYASHLFECFNTWNGSEGKTGLITLPNSDTENYWFVGYNGYYYNSNLPGGGRSWCTAIADMNFANSQSDGKVLGWDGGYSYPRGATGYIRIYSDNTNSNKYAAFIPSGYILRWKNNRNSDAWTSYPFTDTGASNYWETDLVQLGANLSSDKVWVGLATSGMAEAYTWCGKSEEKNLIGVGKKTGASTWAANGIVAGDANQWGKWRIEVTNNATNWNVHFVPYWKATYDVNGGGAISPTTANEGPVSCEGDATVRQVTMPAAPTYAHHDFGGWKSSADNSINAAGATVSLTQNTTFTAQWTNSQYNITATLTNVTSETSFPVAYTYTGSAANVTYTFEASSGYRLPDNVTVTGSTYSWNKNSGELTLTGTITGAVSITISGTQTHTVTWSVNGATASSVTYDHGAALVLPTPDPSAPNGCSSKTFIGWTTHAEISSEVHDKPTLLNPASPGTVAGDVTYRAVFADEVTGKTTVTRYLYTTSISTGKNYIIASSNSAGSVNTATYPGSGNAFTNTSMTVVSGTPNYIAAPANNNAVWSVATGSASGKYYIQNVGTSGNYIRINGSAANISTDATDVYFDSDHGVFGKSGSGSTSYSFYYSSGWTKGTFSTSNRNYIFEATEVEVETTTTDNYITLCSTCTTPSNVTASSISSTGATISWEGVSIEQQPGGSGTGFVVKYGTNATRDLNSNTVNATSSESSKALTGLTPATQYYAWVQAKCDNSWSETPASFHTAAKITYDKNGGTGTNTSEDVTYNSNVTIKTIATLGFEAPSGKTFNGWLSSSAVTVGGSSTTSVADGATISNLTVAITLTAQWRDLASYTVHYSANNGTIAGGADQIVYENGTLTFPNVTPTCGAFVGWIESSSYSSGTKPSGATFHLAGDEIAVTDALDGKTYYAVYAEETAPEPTEDYVLIENEQADWSGDYLIVVSYDDSGTPRNRAMDGSLATLDASSNYQDVTITSKTITSNGTTDGYKFTIAKVVGQPGKYSILSAHGEYMGSDASNTASKPNEIDQNATLSAALYNTISYNSSENRPEILGSNANPLVLTFNKTSGQTRFRYMTAVSTAIQLYKKGGGSVYTYKTSPSCSPTVATSTPASSFTYVYGNGPSASQTFQVSGSNLSANLTVAAPSNYQVSTDNSTFSNSVNVAPTDGKVTSTTIYIRLVENLNVGTYSGGVITVSSTGADNEVSGALIGSVTKAAGAIAFTDFNAVDHYEAEMAAGASSVDVTLTVSVTGDGAVSFSRSPAGGSSAVPATTPTTTLHVTTVGTWTVTANLAAGTNYTNASTNCQVVVYYADRFYDNLHGNSTIVKRNDTGEDHYTIPSLSDETRETSGSCSETHYHFMGWVPESALSTLSNDAAYDAVMITGGGTQAASGTNYYAVWAEE